LLTRLSTDGASLANFITSPVSSDIQSLVDIISERLKMPVFSATPQRAIPNFSSAERTVIPAGWDSRGKIMAIKEAFPIEQVLGDWRKSPHSIIALYQSTVSMNYGDTGSNSDDNAKADPKSVLKSDFQEFLARHYEILESKLSEEPSSKLVTSSSSVINQSVDFNIGGIQVENVEEVLRRLKAREVVVNASTSTSPATPTANRRGERSESSTPGLSPNNTSTSQNEVLANFFQNLLDRRKSSAQNSPG